MTALQYLSPEVTFLKEVMKSGKMAAPSGKEHQKIHNNSSDGTKQQGGVTQRGGTKLPPESAQRSLLGFELKELMTWQSFVRLLCRPTDPANLGVLRFMFGLLMVIDIPQERGMGVADSRWGIKDTCHFPLFNFLQPLPLEWMFIVYLIMLLGAVGIAVGLFYRLSCMMFAVTYWYIFLLDKTSWNNHSYLYGLMAVILLMSDANRYWSLDGILQPNLKNAHVPLWNYTLLRMQIFLVYFIAGLKKFDSDWTSGYSMQNLAQSPIFDPFRLLLTDDQIDLFVVHHVGLTLDLTLGFLLFFDKTRPFAFFFGGSFHIMNSQLFNIGMFPYTMLATLPLFCSVDWPREWFKCFPQCLSIFLPKEQTIQPSSHCLYTKEDIKPEDSKTPSAPSPGPTKPGIHHRLFSCVTVLYIAFQVFLPYSHGITKGYNNWTNGLYGYSWDMMVHTWSTQHIRITYKDSSINEEFYLNPQAWTSGIRTRWASHGDMVKQYAHCIEDRLAAHNITDIELYFDVWMSLNNRFQQRMFDPNMNLLNAPWGPFTEVPYALPLLVDLSDWREKLADIEKNLVSSTNYTDVVFVADFPGLHLENYIQGDLGNTSVTLLRGEVVVELNEKQNFTLKEGDKMMLPTEAFHKVYTVSSTPSCYMYIYVNVTKEKFYAKLGQYKDAYNASVNGTDPDKLLLKQFDKDPALPEYRKEIESDNTKNSQKSMWEIFTKFLHRKFKIFIRSVVFVGGAMRSILMKQPFEDFVQHRHMIDRQEKMKENLANSSP